VVGVWCFGDINLFHEYYLIHYASVTLNYGNRADIIYIDRIRKYFPGNEGQKDS